MAARVISISLGVFYTVSLVLMLILTFLSMPSPRNAYGYYNDAFDLEVVAHRGESPAAFAPLIVILEFLDTDKTNVNKEKVLVLLAVPLSLVCVYYSGKTLYKLSEHEGALRDFKFSIWEIGALAYSAWWAVFVFWMCIYFKFEFLVTCFHQ